MDTLVEVWREVKKCEKKDKREEHIFGGATLPPSGSSLTAYRAEEAAGQRRPSPLCGRHTLKKPKGGAVGSPYSPLCSAGKTPPLPVPPLLFPPLQHTWHIQPIYEWLDDAKCTDKVQCKSFFYMCSFAASLCIYFRNSSIRAAPFSRNVPRRRREKNQGEERETERGGRE